jgi:hypothetical protein
VLTRKHYFFPDEAIAEEKRKKKPNFSITLYQTNKN